jgi:excisionase family DNA binding protein
MLEKYPDVLTFSQLCEALQIGRSLGYFLLQNGIIKSRMVGNVYRIPKRFVLEYLGL